MHHRVVRATDPLGNTQIRHYDAFTWQLGMKDIPPATDGFGVRLVPHMPLVTILLVTTDTIRRRWNNHAGGSMTDATALLQQLGFSEYEARLSRVTPAQPCQRL
jgi:hypothetical protein